MTVFLFQAVKQFFSADITQPSLIFVGNGFIRSVCGMHQCIPYKQKDKLR